MSIRELPDKLRNLTYKSCQGSPVYKDMYMRLIDELEAALPQWTRITEDESTWPEDDDEVLWCEWIDGWQLTNLKGDNCGISGFWRPLCDLDYPEGES